jgi:hypothetical protein
MGLCEGNNNSFDCIPEMSPPPPFSNHRVHFILSDTTPSTGMYKARIRALNQFDGHYNSADINWDKYSEMKKDRRPCVAG